MAEASVPPATQDRTTQSSAAEIFNPPPDQTQLQPDPAQPQPPPATPQLDPNPNPTTPLVSPLSQTISPFALPPVGSPLAPTVPPAVPSFRPVRVQPPVQMPQYTPVPGNPNAPYQIQNPPGVAPMPGIVPGSLPRNIMPAGIYQTPPGQPPNPLVRPPYGAIPNPYAPVGVPGAVPPPGVARFSYPPIVRPPFAPRPPGVIPMGPPQPRPTIHGLQPQVIPSVFRPPILPIVTPERKPHTKVYVGKIATVDNEFMLSLLKLCGPVKDWKRAQDPTNGTLKGFGFCEFDSAEGVLRALRLLSKLNVDGQELMLNIDKATKEYLEHYVEKKRESLVKQKESRAGADEAMKDGVSAVGEEKVLPEQVNGASEPSSEESKKDENRSEDKDKDVANFGLVTDEDREADNDALEKITDLIAERLRTRPMPPPPPLPTRHEGANSNSNGPAKSGDRESDADTGRKDEKNDDEMTSGTKVTNQGGTESPDKSRRYDSKSRDRYRDLKREKEWELEKIERERERERARRERERELQVQKAEKDYERRVKEWEGRERDKEKERKREKEREKEKERERRRLIAEEEDENDDDSRKRRRRSEIEDKRKRRQREKEDDLEDRLREEEEIAEDKKLVEEQRQQQLEKGAKEQFSALAENGVGTSPSSEVASDEIKHKDAARTYDEADPVLMSHIGVVAENGSNDESIATSNNPYDARPSGNIPTKKLGFGIVGSGKRAAVLSVFKEEEDDTPKEQKMRPLVPIDYSNEELQAVDATVCGVTPVHATNAELAVHKEGRPDAEKEVNRRSHDRSGYQTNEESNRVKNENKDQSLDHGRGREHVDTSRNADSKRVLDAKQLIDMIPRTKDELFSYDINWTIYDQHGIHEILRPWISKKIVEFLGEEENSLVEYIVSSTQRHVSASEMLQLLMSILDEEAEMFVLKMWRMLIFEIKKVETGLASRARA